MVPYGWAGRPVGQQLLDVGTQKVNLYVKTPLEDHGVIEYNPVEPDDYNQPESEQVDCCWAEIKESALDIDGWPENYGEVNQEDPRLTQLPPDALKLWDVDFYSLETIPDERYGTDWASGDVSESLNYIYREASTGRTIVDVTLDGFILKLEPGYKAEWFYEVDDNTNSPLKYRKAPNLIVSKKVDGQRCELKIIERGTLLSEYTEREAIEFGKHYVVMATNPEPMAEHNPEREIYVGLDQPIKLSNEIDSYVIKLKYASPQICYDNHLELDVLKMMEFVPRELESKRISYNEPDRFPAPKYWPIKNEKSLVSVQNDQIKVSDWGIQINKQPQWRFSSQIDEYTDQPALKISESRSCEAWIQVHENETDLKSWYDVQKLGEEIGLGERSLRSVTNNPGVDFNNYEENYQYFLGGDLTPNFATRTLYFESKNQLIQVQVLVEQAEYGNIPIPPGTCDDFYHTMIHSITLIQ
ncbi:hypothetical protein IPJ72_06040 [Candidatus Peregrinibacteria bacterium]|nr:MAG: hypothetical protein IPJ72_06040 [Candidatus Peregrinibacteria bacterium]